MAVTTRYLSAGLSDMGRKRENNEDRFHVDPDRGIFLVIDGVGGHAAGEKAADTALAMLKARLERQIGATEERIREGIVVANNEIHRLARENPDWHGMACVLTVAVAEDNRVVIGHVGDSRLYLLQPGTIRKLTHDHSPIGEREDSGDLSEADAMRHPRRNEVFRDVGTEEHTPHDTDFIELLEHPFPPDAALLLCSDGLSDLVPSAHIQSLVEQHAGEPQAAVRALVGAANEAGGKDNVTVVVVEGPQYAAAVRPRSAPAPQAPVYLPEPPGFFASRTAAFLYGIIAAGLAVALLKPHIVETGAGASLAFGTVRMPRTLRVEPGSAISPLLQQALPGDTIVIPDGTYREELVLREGVNVEAEHSRQAVIEPAGIGIAATGIRGARVTGLRITGDQVNTGVHLNDSSVDLVDIEVLGARQVGIDFAGASAGQVLASTIVNNAGPGVIVRDQASPRIAQNVITGNGRGARRAGVEIMGGARPLLVNNTILNNGAEPVRGPNAQELQRHNFLSLSEPPRPGSTPAKPQRSR